jgi:hypothetical protein
MCETTSLLSQGIGHSVSVLAKMKKMKNAYGSRW